MIELPKRIAIGFVLLPLYLTVWLLFSIGFAMFSLAATIQLVWRGK